MRTIRLTERDLQRLVKRVLNESVAIVNTYVAKDDPNSIIKFSCVTGQSYGDISFNGKNIRMEPQLFKLLCVHDDQGTQGGGGAPSSSM